MTRTLEWRPAYAAIIVATAVAFAFSMQATLGPFLLLIVFLLLISPYAGTERHRLLVIASVLLFSVWMLRTLGSLLAPFVLAIGIAYVLDPAVDRLERARIPRLAAIAMLALPALALVGVVLIFGVSVLVRQIVDLIGQLPAALQRLAESIERWKAGLGRLNLPVFGQVISSQWIESLDDRVVAYVQQQRDEILSGAWATVLGFGRGIRMALTILGYLVLTPVLTVYLLRDFDRLTATVRELVPTRRRDHWLTFMREYDRLLSRFLRGQLIAASIVGVLTWLGLLIVGFPYSGLVGAVAGVFNVVPYLGLIVSVVPVLIIALASGSVATLLLKAAIVFAIVQTIDGSVTGPRIVGESVGLHPVWVILALAVGSSFFGFVGLLLAMPAAVLIKLLLREGVERYRRSAMYTGAAGAAE